MPPKLQQAHEALDRAVDKCYRPEPFTSECQRVEFLFARYEKIIAPMAAAESGPGEASFRAGRAAVAAGGQTP